MRRPSVVWLALGLALAVMLAGCARAGDIELEAFLRAAAGAEADRGWHYLDPTTREIGYGNDIAAYVADGGGRLGRLRMDRCAGALDR